MCFFFNDTATTEIYPLSLHDALPILGRGREAPHGCQPFPMDGAVDERVEPKHPGQMGKLVGDILDRKSTRLNSSHANTSYAVFCLKKKKPSRPSSRPQRTISG